MELLSNVHYLVKYEQKLHLESIYQGMQQWSVHKKQSFTKDMIDGAYKRLKEDGFIELSI